MLHCDREYILQKLTEVPSDLVEVQGVVDKGDIQCLNYVVLNHQGPKPFGIFPALFFLIWSNNFLQNFLFYKNQ